MGGRFAMFKPLRRLSLKLRRMAMPVAVIGAVLVAAPSANSAGDPTDGATITLDDVGRLVAQLGDDEYDVRFSASQQLKRAGLVAKPLLVAALENSDAEVRA